MCTCVQAGTAPLVSSAIPWSVVIASTNVPAAVREVDATCSVKTALCPVILDVVLPEHDSSFVPLEVFRKF